MRLGRSGLPCLMKLAHFDGNTSSAAVRHDGLPLAKGSIE